MSQGAASEGTVGGMHRRLSSSTLFGSLLDYTSFDQDEDEDMTTVLWTLLVTSICAILLFGYFSINRMYDEKIYAPLKDLHPDKSPPLLSNKDPFSWITELISIDDATILEKGGYDILAFIRFYRFNFRLFLSFAVYAWAVLLPVNYSGTVQYSDIVDINSFEVWSMSNIATGSAMCWFHTLGIFLLSGLMVYFLENEYLHYAKCRHKFLRSEAANLRTVMVEGIPHKMRTNITLSTYFQTIYPGAIASVSLAQNLSVLDDLIEERAAALRELEVQLYKYHKDGKRRLVSIMKDTGDFNQIDAIKHYRRLVIELNLQIKKEQDEHKKYRVARGDVSTEEAVHVIENLLRVTGSGVVKKIITENSDEGSGGAASPFVDGAGAYGTLQDGADESRGGVKAGDLERLEGQVDEGSAYEEMAKSFSDFGDDDFSDEGWSYSPPPAAQRRDLEIYQTSYESWINAMFEAKSWEESWRIFKDGRHVLVEVQVQQGQEDGDDDVDERDRLIRPFDERNRYFPKAFVTFKTFTAATTARQVIHMQLAGHLAVSEAPEPRDVQWQHLNRTRKGTLVRRVLVEMAVVLLVIFWVVPVTLIALFTNADTLKSSASWVESAAETSSLFNSMLELVQPMCIVGLMQVLPPLFIVMGHFEGVTSFSRNQFLAFDRYFFFQVVNVFLVSTFAGTIIDSIQSILEDPSMAFTLLGDSLPKMGGYFTDYILVKAFIGLGIEIIRLPAMFMSLGKRVFTTNRTERERKEINWGGALRFMSNPGWLPFNKIYAQDLLVTILCASFACVAPLLLVPGLIYFALAGYVYTHQMMYVYEPMYETGGRWWPKVASSTIIALIFAQSTMIGMMILKQSYSQIYFLIFAVIVTLFYYNHNLEQYRILADHLPFDLATSMDLNLTEGVAMNQYVQPALRDETIWAEPMTDFELDESDKFLRPDSLAAGGRSGAAAEAGVEAAGQDGEAVEDAEVDIDDLEV